MNGGTRIGGSVGKWPLSACAKRPAARAWWPWPTTLSACAKRWQYSVCEEADHG
jgi:hypothetical protein